MNKVTVSNLGKNQTAVHHITNKYNLVILVSYRTPVAVFQSQTNDPHDCGLVAITPIKYSVTTTKHIRAFLSKYLNVPSVDITQAELDQLLQETGVSF